MTAPVPDHAALPVEELRRLLWVTRPIISEPCLRCLRNDVGDHRFGGYCAGCDVRHLGSCDPEKPCDGCRREHDE